jgi:hypothetical protein
MSKLLEYTVDGKVQHATEPELRAGQILDRVGINPKDWYLVELKESGEEIAFTNEDDVVHIHEHAKFAIAPIAKRIEYTVDNEIQHTAERELKAGKILTKAGLNPKERYLIELKKDGGHEDFKDPETVVHIHEHEKFVSAFIGPVPVS